MGEEVGHEKATWEAFRVSASFGARALRELVTFFSIQNDLGEDFPLQEQAPC